MNWELAVATFCCAWATCGFFCLWKAEAIVPIAPSACRACLAFMLPSERPPRIPVPALPATLAASTPALDVPAPWKP